LITHEIDVIRRICDEVVVLDRGTIAEQGPVDQMLLHPQHPISRSLILEQTDLSRHDLPRASTVIRITAIGELAQRPPYEKLAQVNAIDYQILHSKVERTKNSLYSQSILALQGKGEADFIQQLEYLGAHIDVIQAPDQQRITEAA